MTTEDKNIIYTLIPAKGFKYDKEFYLVEIYSLCVSVCLFKKNFKYKKLKLYANDEIIKFFKNTEYFDELINLKKECKEINKINTTKFNTNILYKLFIPPMESEPFIYFDYDLFINDKDVFKNIDGDLIFSFRENVIENHNVHPFYKLYFNAFKEVLKATNEELKDFNPCFAYNSSILGSNINVFNDSFRKTCDFFIKYFNEIRDIDKIECFLEQYLQINYLLENNKEYNISTFENIIQKTGTMNLGFDITLEDTKELNTQKLNKLKSFFNDSSIIHLSGDRFGLYYKVLLVDLLNELDITMSQKIKNVYGLTTWNNL